MEPRAGSTHRSMHPLALPLFAVATAPATHPSILMLIFYVFTVPSFILAAIAGRAIGWGIFQVLLLALGLWQYWIWTEEVTNGVRLLGIYVIYGCLNIMAALVFVLYSVIAREQSGWLWPLAGLALDAAIAILTTRIIRGFPRTSS
jgi:hypothetical protein